MDDEYKLLHPNMCKNDLIALQELTNNDQISIRQADKGGAIVVWNTTDYIEEAMDQLNDTAVYRSLDRDPKFDILHKIKLIVEKASEAGLIDTELAQFLVVEQPKTLLLYLLPKIHKSLHRPSGRPIVSRRDSLLNNISIFLDRMLRAFALSSKSFVQDTIDFINKIRALQVPEDVILASFDVTSLYTSINHTRGLEAVRRVLDNTEWSGDVKEFILDLLTVHLTCNYFTFNDKYYMQVRGTALGADVAPAYTNIFCSGF